MIMNFERGLNDEGCPDVASYIGAILIFYTMGSTEIQNTVLESSLVALSAYGYKRGVTIDQGGAKLAKR